MIRKLSVEVTVSWMNKQPPDSRQSHIIHTWNYITLIRLQRLSERRSISQNLAKIMQRVMVIAIDGRLTSFTGSQHAITADESFGDLVSKRFTTPFTQTPQGQSQRSLPSEDTLSM